MNQNVAIAWFVIFVVIVLLISILLWNQGIGTIISALFWLYIFAIIVYAFYSSYVSRHPDPNMVNRIDIGFEYLGEQINDRVKSSKDEIEIKLPDEKADTIAVYRTAYRLGFPLEKGIPNSKWNVEHTKKLEELGKRNIIMN